MEIFAYERLSAMPAALTPMRARTPMRAVALGCAPRAHQILAQRGPVLAVAPTGNEGTSGFKVGVPAGNKRTDLRGVPPRGRPV